MQVAAVVVIYRGCLDVVEVYSTPGKAHKRYEELLKEYDLTEKRMGESDYHIVFEPKLKIF